MIQQAHGEMDVAAQAAGDSSAPPIQPDPVAPREEAPSPEEAAPAPDPEASKVRRLAEQRDKARSALDAKDQELLKLQEQVRELNGQKEMRDLLKSTPEQPEYDMDEQRLLQIAQAGAKYGYEQAMSSLDAAGLQRLTVKEAIRTELGEEVTNAALDAMTDIKWQNRGLTAEQVKTLAAAESPDLFEVPTQQAEAPPSLPASHRVQQPTSESRRISEPKEPSAEEKFMHAKVTKNRKGMRAALQQHLTETLIAPALGSVPHDGSGRIVMRGERLHIKSPRKSR
jgi:hypothetical protein